MPVWLLCGLGNRTCHRRTHIQTTSGLTEAFIQVGGLLVVGVGVLALLALMLIVALHSETTL